MKIKDLIPGFVSSDPRYTRYKQNKEVFKPIEGFNNRYWIGFYGHVVNQEKGILMSDKIDYFGYHYVTFSSFGKKKHYKIHRLVAIAFIPNPENKKEVNHLKGKDKFSINDLEWSTPKENVNHAFRTGLNNSDHCRHDVKSTHIQTGKILSFKSTREAERKLGIGRGYVSAVILGKYKSAKGYKFERI